MHIEVIARTEFNKITFSLKLFFMEQTTCSQRAYAHFIAIFYRNYRKMTLSVLVFNVSPMGGLGTLKLSLDTSITISNRIKRHPLYKIVLNSRKLRKPCRLFYV